MEIGASLDTYRPPILEYTAISNQEDSKDRHHTHTHTHKGVATKREKNHPTRFTKHRMVYESSNSFTLHSLYSVESDFVLF